MRDVHVPLFVQAPCPPECFQSCFSGEAEAAYSWCADFWPFQPAKGPRMHMHMAVNANTIHAFLPEMDVLAWGESKEPAGSQDQSHF